MMQISGNRRSVQKGAQIAGSNVLKTILICPRCRKSTKFAADILGLLHLKDNYFTIHNVMNLNTHTVIQQ